MIKKEQMGRHGSTLNDIVTNVVHILSSDALLHWCELKTSLDTNLPMVEADPIQIQQVLINLVGCFRSYAETPVSTREVEIILSKMLMALFASPCAITVSAFRRNEKPPV